MSYIDDVASRIAELASGEAHTFRNLDHDYLQRSILELADTLQRRRQGLAGRDHLAPDAGMLFVLPAPTRVTMWMKGCRIPLDVLFFDHNKRLINFHTMAAPSPGQADYSLPLYKSDKPAQYALEVSAGTSGRLHIKPGTAISFSPELLKALGKETE